MFAVGAMAERAANVGDFEESFAIIQSLPPEDAVNPPSSIKGTPKSLALLFLHAIHFAFYTKETSTLKELHTLLESMAVEKFVFVSTERDEENGSQGGSDGECIFETEIEKDPQPSTDSDSFTDFIACANVSNL